MSIDCFNALVWALSMTTTLRGLLALLGQSLLGTMMERIFMHAKLARKYTNHCVRATAVTSRKKNGVEDRTICVLTGHKNEKSLSSYPQFIGVPKTGNLPRQDCQASNYQAWNFRSGQFQRSAWRVPRILVTCHRWLSNYSGWCGFQ